MKKIIVYSDEGVGPLSLRHLVYSLQNDLATKSYQIQRAGKQYFQGSSWKKETSLIIFPGGRDIYYQAALNGAPNQLIREYVKEGGKFFGICAGGYYGSGSISFERGYPLEVIANRELSFFSGEARGPVYGGGVFRYGSESGARAANLRWTERDTNRGKEYVSYFNGGCEFVGAGDHENVKILAKYQDVDLCPAAIIECEVGDGKAILSGVHPEYDPKYLDQQDPYLSRVHTKLVEGDSERKNLFSSLLKRLLT